MSSYQMIKGFVLEKSYNSDKKMKKKSIIQQIISRF